MKTTAKKKATKKNRKPQGPLPLRGLYFNGLEWDAMKGEFILRFYKEGRKGEYHLTVSPCCDDLDNFENMASDLRPILDALENGEEEDVIAVREQLREENEAETEAWDRLILSHQPPAKPLEGSRTSRKGKKRLSAS